MSKLDAQKASITSPRSEMIASSESKFQLFFLIQGKCNVHVTSNKHIKQQASFISEQEIFLMLLVTQLHV